MSGINYKQQSIKFNLLYHDSMKTINCVVLLQSDEHGTVGAFICLDKIQMRRNIIKQPNLVALNLVALKLF